MVATPWMAEAKKFIGLREIVGTKHEKKILKFFEDSDHPQIKDDETAWCMAFVNAMLKRSGYKGTGALNARSALKLGKSLSEPVYGCIVVFRRGNSSWQGHVAFFVEKKGNRIKVLGGNQSNMVNESWYSENDLLGYRWPTEKAKPIYKDKVVQAGAVTNAATLADAGNTAYTVATQPVAPPESPDLAGTVVEHAGTVVSTVQTLSGSEAALAVMTNPRFLIALTIIVVVAGVLYWRYKVREKSND